MARPSDIYIDMEKFKLGLYALEDTTKAPFGSARILKNTRVTDSGGLSPRMGTEVLGTAKSSVAPSTGLYNFRKSFDQDEFLMLGYDDELEVYSKNHSSADWFRLKNGFSTSGEFGFATSLVNTANEDYVVFCNRYQEYQRWAGAVTKTTAILNGGETTIPVDSVLNEEILEAKNSIVSSATELTVADTPWAADMWNGMYVYITSGALTGQIRLISATTNQKITFATLGSDPGTAGVVTFEIRKAAFPASGTIIYNGTTIAYTAIPAITSITVGSAHAAASGVAVALVPTVYPAAPRGNRFANYLGRIVVGNVRSALARASGGAYQGFASAGSAFVSKLSDPFDFGFTASRVAGEGDIIAMPYGGGDITDVVSQEDSFYVLKKSYIESISYSQNSSDLAQRVPLKQGVGAAMPVIKGVDDVYFITDDKKFVSLGRVSSKDVLPQTDNIGLPIKRLLEGYVFGTGRGIEEKGNIYIPCRSSSESSTNDIVIVYNRQNKAFDGIWDLHANFFERWNGGAYFSESNSPNVLKMNTGHADVVGTDRFPISSEYASHYMNLTPSSTRTQSMNSLYFEGYIRGNTVITFNAWKEFVDTPFLSFDFGGDETALLQGSEIMASLGGTPLALRPIGSISEAGGDGRKHFQFRVYFPFQYANHFSVGFNSSGIDYDYEITRIGLGVSESVSNKASEVKNV